MVYLEVATGGVRRRRASSWPTTLAAAKRGDWEDAFGYFADDILIHIPGRSEFAGDHRGKDAAVGYIQTMRDRYREGKIELELIDMLASEKRVALLVCERFHGSRRPTWSTRRCTRMWPHD